MISLGTAKVASALMLGVLGNAAGHVAEPLLEAIGLRRMSARALGAFLPAIPAPEDARTTGAACCSSCEKGGTCELDPTDEELGGVGAADGSAEIQAKLDDLRATVERWRAAQLNVKNPDGGEWDWYHRHIMDAQRKIKALERDLQAALAREQTQAEASARSKQAAAQAAARAKMQSAYEKQIAALQEEIKKRGDKDRGRIANALTRARAGLFMSRMAKQAPTKEERDTSFDTALKLLKEIQALVPSAPAAPAAAATPASPAAPAPAAVAPADAPAAEVSYFDEGEDDDEVALPDEMVSFFGAAPAPNLSAADEDDEDDDDDEPCRTGACRA